MPDPTKIDHEAVSLDALVQHLKQRCGYQDIQVERVKRGQDPPDFWLFVGGNKFAVEETSIATEKVIKRIAIDRKKGKNSGSLGWKWEGEVQDELAALMQTALQKKRPKLEEKNVPDQCGGIILVLYDAHAFGDLEDAKIALQKVHGYDWFHSIFWAKVGWRGANGRDTPNELYPDEPGRMGFFLYTKEERWKE
jgi:hypothetical protein